MNARLIASKCLLDVLKHGHSLTDALQNMTTPDDKDTALIKDICFGSLRQHFQLSAIFSNYLLSHSNPKIKMSNV